MLLERLRLRVRRRLVLLEWKQPVQRVASMFGGLSMTAKKQIGQAWLIVKHQIGQLLTTVKHQIGKRWPNGTKG